ncbi:MAG TPA: hypothetical protein ENF84_04490 [Chloroflexi bacterium]|nr:hypothetical protein [Chloroflexota bacterium]
MIFGDEVVCLSVAKSLSMTFNSACLVWEMMAGANIAQTGTAGEALIAIAAGKAAKEGADQAQVLALVKELIPCVNLLVTADR